MKEATDKQLNYIEDLIKNLDDKEQQIILTKIHNGLSMQQAFDLINHLIEKSHLFG